MFSSGPKPKFDANYTGRLQGVLNTFYKEMACPSHNPILANLSSKTREILQSVEKLDKRFQLDAKDVGSLASDLSAVVCSEFDILLCLDINGEVEESDLSPGYARFRLSPSERKKWADAANGEYLIPRKLTDIFQDHVSTVVEGLGDELGEKYIVGGRGSVATTVSVEYKGLKYKADLVIAVKCKDWPRSADADWLLPNYNGHWPSPDVIAQIKANGYEMVAKYVNDSTPGVGDRGPVLDQLWRISVSRAETLLLKTLDDHTCHKKVLIVWKALRLFHLVSTGSGRAPRDVTIIFTSYHLKTIFLHQMKRYPYTSQWTNDKFASRFLSFLYDLHWRINFEDFPTFFFPRVNLAKKRGITSGDKWIIFFGKLMTNPIDYIESALPFDESKEALYTYYSSL